jgi:hypothetical protein
MSEAMCFIELAPLPDMTNRQVIHHGCDDSDKAARLGKCSLFNVQLSSVIGGSASRIFS